MKAPPPLRCSTKRPGMSMHPVSGSGLPPPPRRKPAPRLFSQHKDPEDMAPSIVVHHERTSIVSPEQPSMVRHSAARIDSTTMTDPGPAATSKSHPGPSRTWSAPRTQLSFDKSAQVRPCSSQVVEPEESVLPPVLEELKDDVFMPSPSSQSSRAASTTATAPSTTDTVPSATDTLPNTDSGAEDRKGQKQAVATSDTSYSQEHRTAGAGPSNYPKRPNWPCTLTSSEEDEPPPRPR